MSNQFVQALNLAAGLILLTAVLTVWIRRVSTLVRLIALQGVALAVLVGTVAWHGHDQQLGLLAFGILALKAFVLPYLLRRVSTQPGEAETDPLVNVPASLLAAAALAAISYAVTRPLVALVPSAQVRATPVGLTIALIGLFVLLTRRRAVSQVIGFILIDNGIAVVAFLTTSGVPLVVELGSALDVLLAILVLQILTNRIQAVFGDTDLDGLRELRD